MQISMKRERKAFQYQGRTIYEWEQSLEEILVYIEPPKGIQAKQLNVCLEPSHLIVGLKGNPPFINEDLGGLIVVEQSLWTFDDGILEITLQKANIGNVWTSLLKSHGQLDPLETKQAQESILLERFQREHPGFDFSQASFNGMAPDARTFLGGLDYNKINEKYV